MDTTVQERKSRDVPIVVAGPKPILVKRHGIDVTVQPQGERGVVLTHRSAALARVTEEGLRRRLRAGFDGDVVQLIREAGEETDAKHDAFKAKQAEAHARRARIDELEERRMELQAQLHNVEAELVALRLG